jgi:hypothetical protein
MRGRLSVVSASVLLAGSALLVALPATSASASIVTHECANLGNRIECYYEYTGYGATAAAAEANAATYDPANNGSPNCTPPQLLAGPEVVDGQWYVEYSVSCSINIE